MDSNLAPWLTLKSQDRVSSVNSPARSALPVLFHCRNHQHLCSARKADQELSSSPSPHVFFLPAQLSLFTSTFAVTAVCHNLVPGLGAGHGCVCSLVTYPEKCSRLSHATIPWWWLQWKHETARTFKLISSGLSIGHMKVNFQGLTC